MANHPPRLFVLLGVGGVAAELLDDVALRPALVEEHEVAEMIAEYAAADCSTDSAVRPRPLSVRSPRPSRRYPGSVPTMPDRSPRWTSIRSSSGRLGRGAVAPDVLGGLAGPVSEAGPGARPELGMVRQA